MSARKVKVSAVDVTAETWKAMSAKAREAIAETLETDTNGWIAAHVRSDEFTLSAFGPEFVSHFGEAAAVETAAEFAEFARKRNALAIRVAIGELYAAGMLSTRQGSRGKVSQAQVAKALGGISQARVSQVLADITADAETKAAQLAKAAEVRAKVSQVVDAAKASGLIPDAKDESAKAIRQDVAKAAAKAIRADQFGEALAAVESGKVPTVTPKSHTVAEFAKVVETLDTMVVTGLTVGTADRETVRRIGATLTRLGAYVSGLAVESATPADVAKVAKAG